MTTRRAVAIPIGDDDFVTGGLPRESYLNPWTVVSLRPGDVDGEEGRLNDETLDRIAKDAAGYLGVK